VPGRPHKIHWERKRHTEAKHQVLADYLAAWIPILGRGNSDLILIDGFAGPGRYEDGEPGSPLLMYDAYARHPARAHLGVTAHFFFIEQHPGRAEALRAELVKRKEVPDIEVEVMEGDYDEEFPGLMTKLKKRWPAGLPPIFAFIDPFGAEQNKVDLTQSLLRLPRCEALVFVPMTHCARFVDHPDFEQTLNVVFGGAEWKEARKLPDVPTRRAVLVELFREQLKKSCKWVRAFELIPKEGGNVHLLFFGTSHKLGLTRMKEAMWKLDRVAGQRFRDSTNVDHPVLFEPEPDLAPLLEMLRENFGDQPFSIEEAEDFTLFETPFLHNRHLKQKTLAPAERAGLLKPVDAPESRRRNSYPPGTRIRFVA
jgi:three-Cys-motif partner protein